jgi:PAS domain S-box-containing protein
MTFSTRLMTAMVALVLFTATGIGLLTSYNVENFTPGGLERAAAQTQLLAEAATLARHDSVITGLAAILAAILVAVLLARSLTKPLVQMTRAVEALRRGERITPPTADRGEVGVLARAFEAMAAETDRQTAALKRAVEERHRIFETSLDLILVGDSQGNLIRVSPSSLAILGYQPEEMIGHNAIEFLFPGDLKNTRNEMRLARRGRSMRNFETRCVHKDGRSVTLAWNGVWSEPEQRYFFIGRDLTERRQVEEKFRLAVESCPSGMIMTDGAGEIVMVNGETERLFGYRRQELIGQPIEMLIPERHPESTRMGASRDLNGRRKNGSEFPIEVGFNPIRLGEELMTLSVVVDITERQRVLDALRQSLACQEAVFNSPIVAIITLNESGSIESLNPAAQDLFGHSANAITLCDISSLIDLDAARDISSVICLQRLLADGGIRELTGRHSNGSLFPIELAVAQMPVGERGMFVLFVRNIAVRKQHERMKDEFVATVSHELRTPLTSISASLGLLAANGASQLPPAAARLVTIAQTNCQRLVRLINDILDIEKIESGKVTFNLKPVRALPLIEQAIEANSGFADGFRVRLSLDPASTDAIVRADPDRLNQAVTNLLSNAIKFSPTGGEVVMGIAERGGAVCISVRDYGPGIPEEFKPRVFEKFAQLDTSDARQKGGTGLGLSIVKEIVVRHGGEVGFDPAPGGGTVFHIKLPEWRPPEDILLPEQVRAAGTATILLCEDDLRGVLNRSLAGAPNKRLRILHLDDDADILKAVADALGNSAEVVSVESLDTAREALHRDRFDVAVLDIALPDGVGLDLLPDLRSRDGQPIPVVVFSAHDTPDVAAQVMAVLAKSGGSIDSLVRTLRNIPARGAAEIPHVREVA